ncbi:MAG TPA: ABC transporter permease [Candidatus Dormibacteraeota bacterium]
MTGSAHVVEYDLLVYRHSWRGSMLVSFISPVLFLAAMGVGLGSLVKSGVGTVDGVSYLNFLAPGLMAATAMQTASVETTFPIMAKVFWMRTYEAMLATPLTVRDLLVGDVAWLLMRLVMVAAVYFVVMLLFGVVTAPGALLAIPAAVLTGLAFGAPILAYSATQKNTVGFAAIERFIILPLFMLSGTFFPIDQLPRVLQGVAWLAPLANGVALTRGAVLGTLSSEATAAHVAVLTVYAIAGIVAARVTLRRRLVT